jgi:parvulin-like peptidyl-prolyl isomerase
VSDRALADQLSRRLAAGDKFESLAKAHSEDPGSAPKGGDAGYLIRGSLVPEFETALFEMKRGETSGVVVSPYGFHIIRRGEDRALSKEPLDEAMKARIGQALESQKMQAWFEELRRRHPTTVHTEALNDIVFPSPPPDPSPATPTPSANNNKRSG